MFSNDNAYMLLCALKASPKNPVRLDYVMYRKRFSVTQVPARVIPDKDGNPLFADVDRDKAIAFLKNQHQFYTKAEVAEELHGVASDFSRVVQRE